MSVFSRIFRHPWKQYAAAAGVAVTITFLSLIKDGFVLRISYYNALTMAGAVTLLLGLLLLTAYLGAFDIFGYSFSTLRSQRRYRDLYEYTEAKKEKRRRGDRFFLPWVIVGTGFLITGLLLRIGL